jgi:hypothetical protein
VTIKLALVPWRGFFYVPRERMDVIAAFGNIIAAFIALGGGVVMAVIGWHVRRLHRNQDQLGTKLTQQGERIAKLETQQSLIHEDFRQLEEKIESASNRMCDRVSEVDERITNHINMLVKHLLDGKK